MGGGIEWAYEQRKAEELAKLTKNVESFPKSILAEKLKTVYEHLNDVNNSASLTKHERLLLESTIKELKGILNK